jgi:endonuclease/exonuclease/phosphatase (EEP) superfamily protein YafD
MFDFLKNPVQCLFQQFVPSYRFVRTQADIIDKSHVLHRQLDGRSIKVLNWNIAKNNHQPQWIQDFYKILQQFQPDLIFLQEVRLGLEAEHAVDVADMSWSFAPNFMDAHHQAYAGVLTAAKTNPITSKALTTVHYEPIIQTPKVSLITEYPLLHQTTTLLTVNSHLINFVELNKFRRQLHQLEETIAQHQGPMIFSGDFNTWSQNRFSLLDQVTSRLGLTSVTFPPHHHRNLKRFLLSPPLDYIFYRGFRQQPISARVLNVDSSDHKPLLAEFSI